VERRDFIRYGVATAVLGNSPAQSRTSEVTSISACMKSAGHVPAVIQLTARHDHLGYASLASELLPQFTSIPPSLGTPLGCLRLTDPSRFWLREKLGVRQAASSNHVDLGVHLMNPSAASLWYTGNKTVTPRVLIRVTKG